ncbi:MAG: hypothetical protein CMH65_03375 [Nevskiales bacterium]|nr:hypothetical protein [Nevskiales bacterium]
MADTDTQAWQRVELRADVLTLLGKLAQSRQPVTLTQASRHYLSLLLTLDAQRDELLFDAPAGGFAKLKPRSLLDAQARVAGYGLRFATRVDSLVDDGSLITALPQWVEHAQRRRAHRVNVPRSMPIRATLFPLGGAPVRVRVTDISTQGFGAHVRGEMADEFHPGRVLDGAFGLHGSAFYAPITVRGVRRRGGEMAMGGEFARLDPEDRRTVEREVVELERYWRPRHAAVG